jgi:paraquat-inducible protein B
MSKQANKTVIGLFVVGAIALTVVAIITLGSGKFFRQTHKYVIFFEGSVKGLGIGSAVNFRGVKIGEVAEISLHFDQQNLNFLIPVIVSIYPDRIRGITTADRFDFAKSKMQRKFFEALIEQGLRAQLQPQSFVTGRLFVQLDYFPDKRANFHSAKGFGIDKNIFEIPSVPNPFWKIQKTVENIPLEQIVEDIRTSLAGINELVNNPELAKTAHYVKQMMREIRDLARNVNQKVDPLATAAEETIRDIQHLANSIDRQIDPLANSVKRTADTATAALNDARGLVQHADGEVMPTASKLSETIESARAALVQIESTFKTIEEFSEENSQFRYRLYIALDEISATARSIRSLTDYLEQRPDAILRGKPDTEMGGP